MNDKRLLRQMNGYQQRAIVNYTRLAGEVQNPMFRRMTAAGYSVVLSVNAGYE